MNINDIEPYSGEVKDIIIIIREMANTDVNEISANYFTTKGEVSIKVKR